MVSKYIAKVNGEVVIHRDASKDHGVITNRSISVQEFMYALGYDINDPEDLKYGVENLVAGFYRDDNGDCQFDSDNCEIVARTIVEFAAGPGPYDKSVNYMKAICENDGEKITLYAEIEIPDPEEGEEPDPSKYDDEHYPILKEMIIKQANEEGIDPGTLSFWLD